ncbi:MAG TPA: hypothetical protein VGL53_12160 [Bryobacteraceae bacterium]|jgi:hypothetical protein
MKRLGLLATLATAAWAQVQFYTPAGALLSGSYSPPGAFIVGVKQTININVVSSQAVCIVIATASGSGFLLETPTPDTPSALAVGGTMTLPLDFTATLQGKGASANLEVQYLPLAQSNGCNGPGIPTANLLKADLFVLVNSIASGATVSLQPNGPQVPSVQFGTVATSQTSQVQVYLNNPGTSPITIAAPSSRLDTQGAFTIKTEPAFPLTLNPTQSAAVVLQFAPTATQSYSGAFVVGPVTVPLTGNGVAPAFAAPTIVVDSSLASGIQASLTITLPTPAPVAATGTLFLAFQPSVGSVDDPQIQFLLPAGRKIGFSFNAGDTVATIGTAKSVNFQTGTTAGKLTFSATFQTPPQPVTATIAPQGIAIDSTIANIPNDSQATILLNGFDNTKSITQLAFTFYTVSGTSLAVVPPGKITYDATKDFSQFFQTSTAGGMFSLLAQFPVSGMAATSGAGAAIGGAAILHSVDVEITNSAGTVTLTQLLFSQCSVVISGNCTTGTGCPCP